MMRFSIFLLSQSPEMDPSKEVIPRVQASEQVGPSAVVS